MQLLGQLNFFQQDVSNLNMQNTQAYKVHFFPQYYYIETNQKAVNINKHIVIDREYGLITEKDGPPPQSEQQRFFSAFLGTIYILDKAFLLFIQEVSLVCAIDGQDLFQVQTIAFLPYEQETQIYASIKAQAITNLVENLRKLLSMGFYFSYTYDLTQSKIKHQISGQLEHKFLWNANLVKDFLKASIDKKWITFLIQGFVGYFELYVNGKKLDFYLISRRSSKRAGTRYNSRGIDDDGHVSNYVETEQIIYFNNICCSHLQIRGSVPVFWNQRGYMVETKIMRTSDLTRQAFKKHFKDVIEDYSRVICLNLMSKKKGAEQMVTEAFEEQIKVNDLKNIKYEWFDFHVECKNSVFANSNPLIRKYADHIKNLSYYMEDLALQKIQQIQHGIFRTNCLDCLDRTNFIQTKIAMQAFDLQMKQLGIDFTQILKMAPIEALDEDTAKLGNLFIQQFKNIWADHGDMLSIQYTGTGSTHTNITRTGKRDVQGMIEHGTRSLMRFYMQNFSDSDKQEAMDLILGTHNETVNKFTAEIEKQIKVRSKDYCDYSERSIFVVTWNLGGYQVPTSYDLNKYLLDVNADIVVVGIQEMITTSTALVIGSGSCVKLWDELIFQNLNLKEKYIQIKSKELLGIGSFIYAKERFRDRITKVSYDTVKLGFLGQVANKGCVVIKMNIDDTLVCFANCHFEHGQKSLSTRLVNLQDVHALAFNTDGIGKRKEEKIDQCGYKILFGDLNFRVLQDADTTITQLQRYELFMKQNRKQEAKEILVQLIKLDELTMNRQSQNLKSYEEPPVNFLPTYKFQQYSTQYDKTRTPSWTDRILVGQQEGMETKFVSYRSHDINFSDHRPIQQLEK
ncbi:hypothetical protein pb186bvf_017558 [Paramecium bursaria]